MANQVTILSVDDEKGKAQVKYEDDSAGTELIIGMLLPEEYADESALLDYFGEQWPYGVFEQKGKSAANRHVEAKLIVGDQKNITARVNAGRPPP